MKHEPLVAALNEVLALLEAHNTERAAELMPGLVTLVQGTPNATADERVRPLYELCLAEATRLTSALEREVRTQARGARAANAYGVDP